MKYWWICLLVMAFGSAAAAQQRGVGVGDTPLCRAIGAELRALGVAIVPSGGDVDVSCDSRGVAVRGAYQLDQPLDAPNDVLALRVAEHIRAHLLDISPSETADPAVPASPDIRIREAVTVDEPPETTERSPSSLQALRLSLSAGVGSIFGAGPLLPAVLFRARTDLYYRSLSIHLSLGTSLTTRQYQPEDIRGNASIRGHLLELGGGLMFVRELASTGFFLGVGAGASALRLRLEGHRSEFFNLHGEPKRPWTLVVFAEAMAARRLTPRLRLRTDVRVGVLSRKTVLPLSVDRLVMHGVLVEAMLSLEVFLL